MIRHMYSQGDVVAQSVVYVDSPDAQARISELEGQLAAEKTKPPRVLERVVDRVVETKVDDPALLERLNVVLRENAELKKFKPPIQMVERVVEKIVERPVEVRVPVNRWDLKLVWICLLVGCLMGVVIGRLH